MLHRNSLAAILLLLVTSLNASRSDSEWTVYRDAFEIARPSTYTTPYNNEDEFGRRMEDGLEPISDLDDTQTQLTGADDAVPVGAASLAFVFDITGSMYDDLVQVIEGAAKILATTLAMRDKPLYNYVLVPFHDPEVGPVTVTTDHVRFQQELRDLYVQGGGDCPEMSITGIKQALEESLPYSFIYVFTDARAKDYSLTEQVLSLIQQKQSQVIFVMTGDCGDVTHPGYKAYEKIASTSSGQVFLLKKSQVKNIMDFVRVAVRQRKVNLFSLDRRHDSEKTFFYELPVDSKLQEFTVSVSGQQPQIDIRDPQGRVVTEENGLEVLLNLTNAYIVNVKKPTPGLWTLNIGAVGESTVRITGLSSFDFAHGFSRRPTLHLADTDARPITGIPTHVLVNTTELDPPGHVSGLEFISLYGDMLSEIPVQYEHSHPSLYNTSAFIPPNGFFYLKIVGVDGQGYNFQRITPTAISAVKPDAPTVTLPPVTRGYYDQTVVLNCNVQSIVPFEVRWFLHNQQLGNTLYFSESSNVTWAINDASSYSEGVYTCNATNTAGAASASTLLDIKDPPPDIMHPENVSVVPGDTALMICVAQSPVPFNVTWYRHPDEVLSDAPNKVISFDNGTAIIRNVSKSDEGRYVCRAGNEGGFSEQTTWLFVQTEPKAWISPETQNFVPGAKVVVNCHANAYPRPTFAWNRNGEYIESSERITVDERTGKLTIHSADVSDAGNWDCVARNEHGTGLATAVLNYIESPTVSATKSTILVNGGETAILTCDAKGSPTPVITWYRDGIQLQDLPFMQVGADGRLTILGTQEVDAGEYECVATNEAGTSRATVTLDIGSAPVIVQRPQSRGVDILKNVTLPCSAVGKPQPRISWKRSDGRELDFSGGRFTQLDTGALFIHGIQKEDEGTYTCVVENEFSSQEVSAFLTVMGIVKPLMAYGNPNIESIVGRDIKLTCTVLMGNPTPKITWSRMGEPVVTTDRVIDDGHGNLYLKKVAVDDEGEYMCTATNAGGSASNVIKLDILVPPSISDSDTDYTVTTGQSVRLVCEAHGDPKPQITWTKNGMRISEMDPHYFMDESGSLEIFSVDQQDTATYMCTAINVAGVREKRLTLMVQIPPTMRQDRDEYTVIVNSPVQMSCEASGLPPPAVSWYKNGVLLGQNQTADMEGIQILGNGALRINRVNVSDSGTYECVASNIAGTASRIVSLTVQVPPTLRQRAPAVITAMTGDEVILPCEVTADPLPQISWRKNHAQIDFFDMGHKYLMQEDAGSLIIPKVDIDDSARYLCLAENPAGVISQDITLIVYEPPSMPHDAQTNFSVIERDRATLTCVAKGTPSPRIRWYKDGQLVTGNEIGVRILTDGSLQMDQASDRDAGVYTCVAENIAGNKSRDMELFVYSPPRFDNAGELRSRTPGGPRNEGSQTANENESVRLRCMVSAVPTPQITWYKNGEELRLDDTGTGRFQVSPDGKELTISDLYVNDTARYTCIARNLAGEAEKNFALEVHSGPKIDESLASERNMSVIVGRPVLINCPVVGVPTPIVTWYKDDVEIKQNDLPDVRILSNGRQLEIPEAEVADAGRYRCSAKNVAGYVDRDYELHVLVPSTIEGVDTLADISVILNKSVTLHCPASGWPRPQLSWFHDNQPVQNSSNVFLLDDGWRLHIEGAELSNKGRYSCQAINEAGEAQRFYNLSVHVTPSVDRTNLKNQSKVLINGSQVFDCPVSGVPSPDVVWMRNGELLDLHLHSNVELRNNGRQLVINGVVVSDSATYRCVATNAAGQDHQDFTLEVHVPATIDKFNKDLSPVIIVGQSRTIDCIVYGVPAPKVAWFRNGTALNLENSPNMRLRQDGRYLEITSASVNDTAVYECHAANEAGRDNIQYNVNVHVPPEIILKTSTSSNIQVKLSETAVIKCHATGTPPPAIDWLVNGQLIDRTDQRYDITRDGQTLRINDVVVTDTGRYTCVAKNAAGIAERDFDLEVVIPPYIEALDLERHVKVVKSKIIVLQCPVQGIPFPNITWLKNNEPLQPNGRIRVLMSGRQLELSMAEESDTAWYTCTAVNVAGSTKIDFNLTVFVPPVIDEANVVDNPKIIVNRTVLLECPVGGIPPPAVRWLKNGEPLVLTPRIRLISSGRHVEITRAQVTDTARYTCIAVNDAGELRRNYDLEVLLPPTIDGSKVENVEVIENHTTYLSCNAQGIPPPTIMWFRNSVPLFDTPYTNVRELNGGHQLEIRNVRSNDEAVYKCQANNVAGQQMKSFKLRVFMAPKITGSRSNTELSVTQRRPIRMDCDATGVPTPNITWTKDGFPLEGDGGRVNILQNGQLLMLSAAAVDDSGVYMCTAQNVAGIDHKQFRLQVLVPPYINGSHMIDEQSVVMGNSIVLHCPAGGSPEPIIRWTREGEAFSYMSEPNLRVQEGGTQLQIFNAQLLDIGSYACIATNPAGMATKEFLLNIMVPPTIEGGSSEVAATVGSKALLMCDTIGLPKPDVTWKKDGVLLSMTDSQYVMHRTGSLQFFAVSVADSGLYECIAENEAGIANREITLSVQVPPKIDTSGPLYKKVIVGEAVELPCNASGTPKPRIVWQKGTRMLAGTVGYKMVDKSSLLIESADVRDAGIYVCIAQNNAGTALSQIRLEVQVPPVIEQQQTEFTVVEEREIILPCRVSGLPTPSVKWFKDNETISPDDVHYRILRSQWLAIPIVRAEDAGHFICFAENEAGNVSLDMRLIVHVPPTIEDAERVLTVNESDTARLPCIASGFPAPRITWIQDGRTLLTPGGRYEFEETGSLIINNVQHTDTASYVCTAKNAAARASKEFILRVQVPPRIVMIPRSQEVNANGRVELECAADGIPVPVITWRFNGTEYQTAPSFNGRSKLMIDNVMKRDDGTYMCVAENPAGRQQVIAGVRVKVPPKVIKHSENQAQAVSMTDKVVLNCPVDGGDPPPTITWFKQDHLVELDERVYQTENGSLVIYDANNADAGEYKCVATNDAGTTEGFAHLTVTTPPEFSVEPPEETTVEQGQKTVIDCTATGEPQPTITWYKDNVRNVIRNEDRISVLANNSLRIVAVQLSDNGSYICMAKNPLGSVLTVSRLKVQVNGHWSMWSSWTQCSVTCGEGTHSRSRRCDHPAPMNGGRTCVGLGEEIQTCVPRDCPVDGVWSEWSLWEECSTTCGQGQRSRVRECNNPTPAHGGQMCRDEPVEYEKCNLRPCPVDGSWSMWSPWRECSETCGTGVHERYRRCDAPAPEYGGQYCVGSESERQPCHLASCEVDGNWGAWSEWGMCSLSCGGGKQMRRRKCDSPAPSSGGKFCAGPDTQSEYCNEEECPVHSEWSKWSDWGACTVTCGGGQRRRFRSCQNPSTKSNARPCVGVGQETEACNPQKCAVDGKWSVWGPWSECTKSCDGGIQQRQRTCQRPSHGGNDCYGDVTESRHCNTSPCLSGLPKYAIANVVGNINGQDFGVSKILANISCTVHGSFLSATFNELPPSIGQHMRHLMPILSSIYWTTAAEQDKAINGYSLTNGQFRQEVQVEYATGEILKMTQISRGVDASGILQIDILVNGRIPLLPLNSKIKVLPYHEDFIQTGPASIYGYSSRMFHVDGHPLPYAVNQTITYDATERRLMPYLVQRISVDNVETDCDDSYSVVYYNMTTAVTKGEPSNRCPTGFLLDANVPACQDIDECSKLKPCSHVCENTLGSFKCSCPSGLSLSSDGKVCRDVDECELRTANCPRALDCLNTVGSYQCVVKCDKGHRRNPITQQCEDINECQEKPGVCEQECTNTRGSYRCTCRLGFRLVARSKCEDINECHLKLHRCNQQCVNIAGGYQCTCRPGYRLSDQHTCIDIDECAEQAHTCHSGQQCQNTDGGHTCISQCPTGHTMSPGGNCVDIDECATGANECQYNHICTNTVGGYTCTCQRGYRADSPTTPCVDIDECETSNQCQHSCINTLGSFQCTCPRGYRLSPNHRTCIDIDECVELSVNCGHNKRCFNRRGDFECVDTTCPPNYQRDPTTGYCVLDCHTLQDTDGGIPCDASSSYRQILEFHLVALPSGITANQDLIRLLVYDQNNVPVSPTMFTLIDDDDTSPNLPFGIRTEDGKGIVYTTRPLADRQSYQLKVEGIAYDERGQTVLYHTTFMIYISIASYPY